MDTDGAIAKTTAEIKNLSYEMEIACAEIGRLRANLERNFNAESSSEKFDSDYWRYVGVHDALAKFLKFSTSDVSIMGDIALAQHARYFFDAMAWVKHLINPNKDPTVYFEHLLRGKKLYYESKISNCHREIRLLRQIGKDYDLLLKKTAIRAALLGKPTPNNDEINALTQNFHGKLDKQFSIYSSISFGNYEEYALLVEENILAGHVAELQKLNSQIHKFEVDYGKKISKNHDSKKFSQSVEMDAEYDFIFRLSSQHLHATPVSLSTDLNEVSNQERLIFLEYLRKKGRDILACSLFLALGFKEAKLPVLGLGPDSRFSVFRRGALR